jgi:DNA invertase Pin-like site-specific DNA recombinase
MIAYRNEAVTADATETAWAYLVVSSDAQGDTLADQKAWAYRTAAEHGWSITEVFEGVSSGAAGVRSLLDRLLTKLRETPKPERPARVILTRIDRLGRGLGIEAIGALAEIRKLGVTLHTREDGDVTIKRAADAITPVLRAITGALENEARKDKATAVYDRKRRAGKVVGNRPPYGLQIVDGQYVIEKNLAPAIRQAFTMRAKGVGYHSIAKRMNEIAPPQLFRNGNERTVRWSQNRVLRLLTNEAYRKAGLVDDITWKRARAQTRLGVRERRQAKRPWPLSGVLQCPCGRTLIGHASSHGGRLRYMKCTATWAHGGSYILHRSDRLEADFEALLISLRATPSLIEKHARGAATASERDRKALEKERARLTAAIADLDKTREAVWDLFERGKVREGDVQPRLDRLRETREDLSASLRDVTARLDVFEASSARIADIAVVVRDAARLWRRARTAGDVAGQQALARTVSRRLGGLTVRLNGTLRIGNVTDAQAQRRPKAAEA